MFHIINNQIKNINNISIIDNDKEPYIAIIEYKDGTREKIDMVYIEYLYNLQEKGTINMMQSWHLLIYEFHIDKRTAISCVFLYFNKYNDISALIKEKILYDIVSDTSNVITSYIRPKLSSDF